MLYIILLSLLVASGYYIYLLRQKIEKLQVDINSLESSYTIIKDAYDETKNNESERSFNRDFETKKKDETYINNSCKTNVNRVTTDSNTYRQFNSEHDPDLSNNFFNPANIAMTSLLFERSYNDKPVAVNVFNDETIETDKKNYIENDDMETSTDGWNKMECTYNDDTGLTCDDSSYDSGSSFDSGGSFED